MRKKKELVAEEMVAEIESFAAYLPSDRNPRETLAVAAMAAQHAAEERR